jgi:hypothetical protein
MADDAFALSPISARAALPSEADYDAIQEAFMETSRGRWFLGEYAKRNRNTDTKMVLDAVARIEETLAAQRKPERDPLLDQALESVRAALTQAREAAHAALADLALEQNLAPVRKGARVIREIAWRLREIGADGRICDLIDSQVGAIERAAAKIAPADLAVALSGAFDRIEAKLGAFDAGEVAAEPTPPPAAEPTPPQTEMASSAAPHVEAAVARPEASDETPVAAASSEPPDAFDAGDEAMLDMIAMEMAAPDTDAAYESGLDDAQPFDNQAQETQIQEGQIRANQADDPNAGETSAASYEIDVTFPDLSDTPQPPATPPVASPVQSAPMPKPALPAELVPEPAPSLGASLIANGIVPRPRASRPDPLAPIRRMSQTEKIAFFS